jgi:chromate transporter
MKSISFQEIGMQADGHEIEADSSVPQPTLVKLILMFLRIGCLGFGGGMAIIALMEREIVQGHRWQSSEEFAHGVSLGQVLGPFAVNTAFFIGYRFYGPIGALLSAGSFTAPSVIMVLLLSRLYFGYHSLPALQAALQGTGPIVIGLIVCAAWSMARKTVKTLPAAALVAVSSALGVSGLSTVYLIAGAGMIGILLGKGRIAGWGTPPLCLAGAKPPASKERASLPGSLVTIVALAPTASTVTLLALGLVFFKIGWLFFGGGYVVVPLLYQRIVAELAWLRPQEFVDGVAISNLTPGPISVLATFIGYKLQGVAGALVATTGLYLPAAVTMFALSYGYGRFRGVPRFQDFLAGVTPALVGLILSAAVLLGRGTLVSWKSAVLAILAILLLERRSWPPLVVLAIGAILGVLRVLP